MDKAIIAPNNPEWCSTRKRTRHHPLLRAALAFGLLVVCGYGGLFTDFQLTRSKTSSAKIPINAQQILQKCANLNVIPGPPPDFYSRTESDRYVAKTRPTLIKNATIWTGNVDGLEVVLGDLLLDRGIIQAVGQVPVNVLNAYDRGGLEIVDANGSWVSPGIVDLHSHLGDYSSPKLKGSDDTNSRKGLVQPWLRSLDSLNTHDDAYQLSIAGGVSTAVILPGSANAIGGQAFVIKLRPTEERSPSSMLLEPPFTFNGSGIKEVQPPRWRQLKQACGENPSRFYSGTRMDTIWAYRKGYEEARKLKVKQDAYCEKAAAGQWNALGDFPDDLKWEALVDVLRGKVKIQNHCYEAVDLDGIVRLTNEFKFPIAAFHHAHETYLVPELLKKAYGHTPAVALFATAARYKRESYRGSEFAPRILADQGIEVVMKSDHPVLNSRFLVYEAQQAHYYGLAANLALASVTSTPAKIMGQEHRIGYVRKGYDADIVLWDSHPLALGATPKQVFIDGVAQLKHPFVVPKSEALQHVPNTPDFEEETKAALEYDGLPPLEPKESVSETVIFENFDSLFLDLGDGVEQIFTSNGHEDEPQIAIVQNGKLSCIGTAGTCPSADLGVDPRIVDLHGGSLAPGLVSYGSPLGLVHILGEETTQDGEVFDGLTTKIPSILGGDSAVIRAVDGLQFTTRDALLAHRSGVSIGVTAPCSSSGVLAGLSTAFSTGAAHKLVKGAVVKDEAALHVSLSPSFSASVSTQIAMLRTMLDGGAGGELGVQVAKVLEGKMPLVIGVHSADIMASLIQLKSEIERTTGSIIKMTFAGGSEAHLLAKEIAAANVGVIIAPARSFPFFWDMRRILPGPPLTQQSAVSALLLNNVTVGVGVNFDESWAVRNTRFDVSWAALQAGGEISKAEAISLASSNLEKLLGLSPGTVASNLVATSGGTILDVESKVVAVASAKRGVVDLF